MDIKSIKFDQEDIINFISKFSNKSNSEGWKIKVNGEFIKVASGKSLWTKKIYAQNALKGHFNSYPINICLCYVLNEKYLGNKYHYDGNKLWNYFLDFLQENGILEFVKVK